MSEPGDRRDPSPAQQRAGHKLLENALRRAIVQTLEATPGLNKNQIARAIDATFSVTRYHLKALVDAGLVLELDSAQGNEGLFFLPEDRHLWENERTRVLFGREGVRRVALYIAENPGTTTEEIAEAFDLSMPATRWHTRNLQKLRLAVKAQITKGHFEYHPTTPLMSWAEEVGPRYEGTEAWIGARTTPGEDGD